MWVCFDSGARLYAKCSLVMSAGLWEFPAVKVAADAGKADCRRAMDKLLEGPLGVSLAEEHVVSRQSLGDVVHIFSHIRLTMRAEHIMLQVCTSTSCMTPALVSLLLHRLRVEAPHRLFWL